MNAGRGPTKTSTIPERTQHMPLLRSLADCASRVAINMALLTELFATPSPPRRTKDACNEQPNPSRDFLSLNLARNLDLSPGSGDAD